MQNNRAYQEALSRIRKAKELNSTELNLKELGLTEIPEEISELHHLEILLLNSPDDSITPNRLSSFPQVLLKLKKLSEIGLSFNLIEEIPTEIAELTNLKNLRLFGLKFRDLAETLNRVKQLETIGIDVNEETLKKYKQKLKRFPKLEIALVNENLTEIPETLFEFENISMLWIRKSKIKRISPSIINLKQLRELWAYSNQIEEIPEELGNLVALQKLYVLPFFSHPSFLLKKPLSKNPQPFLKGIPEI